MKILNPVEVILGESFRSRVNHAVDFITASGEHFGNVLSNINFTDWDRDKALGFLVVYNYFRQLSTFLSISFELDTGLALFCF